MPQSSLAAQLCARFASAVEKRRESCARLSAFRLVDGAGDGMPGVYVDKFAAVLVAHLLDAAPAWEEVLLKRSFWDSGFMQKAGAKAVYLRVHRRRAHETARAGAVLVAGEAVEELDLNEHGLTFRVRPAAQVNAGLFLDMRELRGLLRDRARGARVLNLFCFTGSLGIAAYAGRAETVVQVDVSKAALGWARENWLLNRSLGNGRMRFVPEDARTFLQREARRRGRGAPAYDMVVLDPPAYGSSKRGKFALTRDAAALIRESLAVLTARGTLVLTANQRSLSGTALKACLTAGVREAGGRIVRFERLAPPAQDFTSAERESAAMRGWWCEISQEGER